MNDLISRKAALQILEYVFKKYRMSWGKESGGFCAAVQEGIEELPIAFDKEKVHSELIELRNAEVFKPDFATKHEENWSHGRYSAFLDAIRIVEKGGIE